jgi:uncharacterized protein
MTTETKRRLTTSPACHVNDAWRRTLQIRHDVAEEQGMSARFTFDATFDARWTPRFPELAAVANAVSIAMPHVEPCVIRTIRTAHGLTTSQVESSDEADREVRRFAADEAAHHVEHRRFNEHVLERYPALRLVDRANRWSVAVVDRLPLALRTGFASGFELLGLCVATWIAPRAELLFGQSNPEATRLFLWHLGEEVGHRSIAHDVHRSRSGAITQALGLMIAFAVLGLGAALGACLVFARDGRWYRPVSWWRLTCWGLSFFWASGPILLGSLWRHPSKFSVPLEADAWSQLANPAQPLAA